jgi:hypothetical protein
MSANITNEMKADCIGKFSFDTEEPCPKCALELDESFPDIHCLCDNDPDGDYMKNRAVPWDTCKEIYKRMAKHENRLSADPLTALAAVMREHNLEIATINGLTISYADAGIIFDIDKTEPVTAEDIKPEPSNA